MLDLLKRKAGLAEHSELTSKVLAQHCAFTLFGLPEDDDAAKLKCYVDTLRNLILLSDKLETLPTLVCARVRRFVKANPGILPPNTLAKSAVVSVGKPAKEVGWATCYTNTSCRTGLVPSRDGLAPPPSLSNWSMFPEMSSDASELMIPPPPPPPSTTATRRWNTTSNFNSWKKQRQTLPRMSGFGPFAPVKIMPSKLSAALSIHYS